VCRIYCPHTITKYIFLCSSIIQHTSAINIHHQTNETKWNKKHIKIHTFSLTHSLILTCTRFFYVYECVYALPLQKLQPIVVINHWYFIRHLKRWMICANEISIIYGSIRARLPERDGVSCVFSNLRFVFIVFYVDAREDEENTYSARRLGRENRKMRDERAISLLAHCEENEMPCWIFILRESF
jgi:hypothetical protein